MNFKKITFIFLSWITLISCKKNIPEISRGELSGDWFYKNSTMNFSLQLPKTWNFVDNENGMSNFIPMNQKLQNVILQNDQIKITEEYSLLNEKSVFPLFTISKNDLNDIKSGNRKADISFTVISSKNGNAENDIKTIKNDFKTQIESHSEYSNINKENFDEINELDFGKNKKIPYIKISIPDISGNISGNRIYAFNNYGNYNLLLIVNYFNNEELKEIKEILSNVK